MSSPAERMSSRFAWSNASWASFFAAISRKKTVQHIKAELDESAALDATPQPTHPATPLSATLPRVLNVFDLVAYGVGSTVGVGVFVITGVAAKETAGPALVFSFVAAAVACFFSGLCYCEFATRIPVSGSAYTYAYATMGELIGWLIGWNLTLEYGISASATARGWADYLESALQGFGVELPSWLTAIDMGVTHGSLLSIVILVACTALVAFGVKESARFNLAITACNLCIILFVIIVGGLYVDKENWRPFSPMGFRGVMRGAAKVFFAYIGFDTVSSLAEEVRHPQRDLPLGISGTLGISAALYCGVCLVVTGMVNYTLLDSSAPLSKAFTTRHVHWAADIVAIGSVTTLTATTVCSLLGQPRIFYRMAKDGLYYQPFASINSKTKTPLFGTIFTGALASLLAFFLDVNTLADMISSGTLLAFVMVCGGVLLLRYDTPTHRHNANVLVALLIIFSVITAGLGKAGVKLEIVIIVGAVLLAPVLALFLKLPKSPERGSFMTPLVPFLPATGIFVNVLLIFELEMTALYRLVVWTFIGLCIYLSYGILHSRLPLATSQAPRGTSGLRYQTFSAFADGSADDLPDARLLPSDARDSTAEAR